MTLLIDASGIQTLTDDVATTARKYWWLPLVTGLAWMAVAVLVFRFDTTTVAAVSALFGFVAIGAGISEFMLAAITQRGWRVAHALLGVLFVVIGATAFAQPWSTFVGLAATVGIFLMVRGTIDLVAAVGSTDGSSQTWILGLAAFAELALGLWAAGSWELSVVVLIAWVGATALLRGITEITTAFTLRELGSAAG